MTFYIKNFAELRHAVEELKYTSEHRDLVFETGGGFQRLRFDDGVVNIPVDSRGVDLVAAA